MQGHGASGHVIRSRMYMQDDIDILFFILMLRGSRYIYVPCSRTHTRTALINMTPHIRYTYIYTLIIYEINEVKISMNSYKLKLRNIIAKKKMRITFLVSFCQYLMYSCTVETKILVTVLMIRGKSKF